MSSRRTFLRAAGAAAIGAPLLARFARPSFAQDSEAPKRLVVVYSPNGTVPDAWGATGSGSNMQFRPILEPLAPFAAKTIVVDGLGFGGGFNTPHSKGTMMALTNRDVFDGRPSGTERGAMTGPSLDTAIAKDLGRNTFRDVLRITVSNATGSNRAYFNFDESGTFIRPQADPLEAFRFLFPSASGAPSEPMPSAMPDARAQQMLLARRSMIDLLKADAERLRARLPTAQRPKMEAALEAIRSQERALAAMMASGAAGGGPVATPVSCEEDPSAPAAGGSFQDRHNAHIGNIAAAFACDVTRIVTFMLAPGADSSNVSQFADVTSESYHDCSHRWESDDAKEKLTKVNRYFASVVARLAGALDAIPEGDGTVLDNTVILWTNECWHGNHDPFKLPIVLVGSAGGALRTGRVFTPATADNRSYGRLLVSLANAVGHPMTTFGDPRWGSGPLPGLLG